MVFGNDFMWGGASAAYQIEGAAYEDGKGLSIWDVFCKEKGRIIDGTNADVACDHYHRFNQDVQLMKEIGYKAYRFSLSWPRIIPSGTGAINVKGLDFYDKLTDSLLDANITPFVTLYHWDLPYELYKKGGWLNPDSSKWFEDYAAVVAARLGDRIKHFFTFNEPQCFIGLIYNQIRQAPGIHLSDRDRLQMMHNVLLAHGKAARALHQAIPNAQVGIAPTCRAHYPIDETAENIAATKQAYLAIEEDWAWSPTVWSDPVIFGKYPKALLDRFEGQMPSISANDMAIISEPTEMYGQNIYNGSPIMSDGKNGYVYVPREPGYTLTAAKWPMTPKSLYWAPKILFERYQKPFYITENGISCHDMLSSDGKIHDPNRIEFLRQYLVEYRKAIHEGVDARGYFHWCVTDNFEWDKGYTERFGMVYCDFQTQERILKDSAYWYNQVITTNGSNL